MPTPQQAQPMEILYCRIPPEYRQQLAAIAASSGVTVSEVARAALRQAIAREAATAR
jgi:transposase-like protein